MKDILMEAKKCKVKMQIPTQALGLAECLIVDELELHS